MLHTTALTLLMALPITMPAAVAAGTERRSHPLTACHASAVDPPVAAVLAAALRHAGLTRGSGRRWLRRLRWAALLPRLGARVQQTSGWTEYLDLRPEAPDNVDLNNRLGVTWQIHATWRLDRLLFDVRELAAERTDKRFGKQRRQLTERIVRLYFERQQLKSADDSSREDEIDEELPRRQLRLCRVTALLDALAGGFLLKKLAHPPMRE